MGGTCSTNGKDGEMHTLIPENLKTRGHIQRSRRRWEYDTKLCTLMSTRAGLAQAV
jgi:6-phosphofructokinase